MIVKFNISPEEILEDEDGVPFTVPELAHWMIVCTEHGWYIPVTCRTADLDGSALAAGLVDHLRSTAQDDTEIHGCGCEVPDLMEAMG